VQALDILSFHVLKTVKRLICLNAVSYKPLGLQVREGLEYLGTALPCPAANTTQI
jgi:hypothetical protein